jgi:hypothetical protein
MNKNAMQNSFAAKYMLRVSFRRSPPSQVIDVYLFLASVRVIRRCPSTDIRGAEKGCQHISISMEDCRKR